MEASEGSEYSRANDDDDDYTEEGVQQKPFSDNSNKTYSPFSDANRLSGVPTNASSTNVSYQSPSAPGFGNSQPAPRQSIDAYGAFSDPAPSGFAGGFAPNQYADSGPRISRTMQYADPYAAVRASIASSSGNVTPPMHSTGVTPRNRRRSSSTGCGNRDRLFTHRTMSVGSNAEPAATRVSGRPLPRNQRHRNRAHMMKPRSLRTSPRWKRSRHHAITRY